MKSLSGKPHGLDNIDVVTMAEWPILFVLFGQAKYILLDVVNWVLNYLLGWKFDYTWFTRFTPLYITSCLNNDSLIIFWFSFKKF